MIFRVSMVLVICVMSGFAQVRFPAPEKFFPTEKVVNRTRIPNGEVRMLETKKDFKTLKTELATLLGEGWKTEAPKDIKGLNEKQKKMLKFSKDTLVIFVHPKNPRFRVSLALTTLPTKTAGAKLAILTLARNFVPQK
jgi:hypothetical protein